MADEPAAALAALRSMFTHPEAGLEVRTAMSGQQQQVAALMPGKDAVLRAGLIGALTFGTVIGRHLLQLDGYAMRREIIRIHPERILSWGLGDSSSRRNVARALS